MKIGTFCRAFKNLSKHYLNPVMEQTIIAEKKVGEDIIHTVSTKTRFGKPKLSEIKQQTVDESSISQKILDMLS